MNTPNHTQQKGLRLLFIIGCVLFSGCTLADACKDNEYRQGEECIPCPEGKLVSKTRDACVDTVKSCGTSNTNCLEAGNGVVSAECVEGKCEVTECYTDYFPSKDNTVCYKGGSTPEDCGSDGINCMTEGVVDAICHESKCKALKCETEYHLSQDETRCDIDTPSQCGAYNNNCYAEELHIQEAACNNKACNIVTCKPNYHPENRNNIPVCAEDTIQACGLIPTNCTQTPNTTAHQCVNGECIYECESNTEKLAHIDGCMRCSDENIDYTDSKAEISGVECTKGNVRLKSTCPRNHPLSFECWFKSDSLVYIGGTLSTDYWAEENSYVVPETIEFPMLKYVNTLHIHDSTKDYHSSGTPPYNEIDMSFDALTAAGEIIIDYIASEYIEFAELETIDDRLTVANNQLDSFYFSSVKSIGNDNLLTLNIEKDDYYALTIQDTISEMGTTNFNFYSLKQITGGVRLINNQAQFEFNSLETIKGTLDITGGKNDTVSQLEFPKLENIISTYEDPLMIMDMPYLTSIRMPLLKKIGDGKIIITNCPKLTQENCDLGENTCIIQ